MCRLFAMTSSPVRVRATFWLLEAADSLSAQIRRDPDGTGLGYFDPAGRPVVRRAPVAAFEDRAYAEEAREVESSTFIAHVRYASTGGLVEKNTPFFVGGRLLCSLNVIIVTADELWALRYPETRSLYVLERRGDGPRQERRLDHKGAAGRLHVRSGDLADAPAVVVASERLDEDPAWRALQSGELLHVRADLSVESRIALPEPTKRLFTLEDLRPEAASSQSAA